MSTRRQCCGSTVAVSIDCFCNVELQRCKESDFLGSGQIASGDLSARTHTHTDKCKISIMIIININIVNILIYILVQIKYLI